MILNLIKGNPTEKHVPNGTGAKINIAEMFCNTVQGEGVHAGVPATFIRLKDCTLACNWCDTLEVWRHGNTYHVSEILDMLKANDMIDKYRNGRQHIVLTGGSPLLQQEALISLINMFVIRFGFKPYFEVENETVLMPLPELEFQVECWNNSPKLANSGMREKLRYEPEVIHHMSKLNNSWFKFVVSCDEDWQEIQMFFLDRNLISKDQIILMPEGQTREQLELTREMAVNMAVKHGVRFSDRMHVTVWDRKTGV